MTKQQKKIRELNLMMDNALGGAVTGLIGLDSTLDRLLGLNAFKGKLEALGTILQQRHQLQKSVDLLSRPVEQRANGTLFYTGKSR